MPTVKAIVTGHTHGLGAALRTELLGQSIPVLGLARSCSPDSGSSPQVTLDLSSSQALQAWLASPALHDFLLDCDLAVLINNAGVVQPVGPLGDQDPAHVAMAVALNVAAPLMLSAAVARIMAGRQTRIVHISSGAGSSAYPGWSVYCATKAALDHHARAVALDAVPGLRVCSLAPGVIDTAMQAQIRTTPVERFPMRERFVEMKESGVLVSPQDCARRVVGYVLGDGFGRNPVDDLRKA
jgi:NAD(P)-dependent dehydrogenase (short-subunit alcohol dehydrogenase family)